MNKFVRFVKDESGATAIEYGLIAAAMGLALVTAMPILASATADYIGTNTRQEKEVTVHEEDETVKFIKKGM